MNYTDSLPFFIVGSPRSGTTLLVTLLNRHSRIFIPPETAFFTKLKCFNGEVNCKPDQQKLIRFVDYYLQQKAVNLLDLPKDNIREILLSDAHNYIDLFYNLMRYLLKLTGKARWGEKTPHHLRVLKDVESAIPEAKFIILLRDGRAVIKSRLSHPNWDDNYLSASRIWSADMKRIQEVKTFVKSDKFCLIRYEELVANPDRILADVLTFLGEDYGEDSFNAPANQASLFNAYYSQPWMSKSTSSIDMSRANNWVYEYSSTELALVQKLIGSELNLMGYSQKDVGRNLWLLLFAQQFVTDIVYQTRRVKRKLARKTKVC